MLSPGCVTGLWLCVPAPHLLLESLCIADVLILVSSDCVSSTPTSQNIFLG